MSIIEPAGRIHIRLESEDRAGILKENVNGTRRTCHIGVGRDAVSVRANNKRKRESMPRAFTSTGLHRENRVSVFRRDWAHIRDEIDFCLRLTSLDVGAPRPQELSGRRGALAHRLLESSLSS